MHSTARGPALGGCRMLTYDDSRSAVRDALRLSRAMTYKSAVADLPLGGGKGVIVLPRGETIARGRRRDALLDFGDTVAALGGSYVTAEDVGTSSRDMTVVAQRTTHVSGLSRRRGGSGDPSPHTALGVETAIRVTCERVFGTDSLSGRSISIVGLGNVGSRVAARCARAGARLIVADVDASKRALAQRLGARWTSPGRALAAPVDLLSPCALGGVLDHETVPALRCQAIAGAANNQLARDDVARLLHKRGILWAPDFVANAGGIINIAVELEPQGYDPKEARGRVKSIGKTLRIIFDSAQSGSITPLEAAMRLARARLEERGSAQLEV